MPQRVRRTLVTIAGHETEPTYVNADGCGLVEAYFEACGGSRASLPSAASGSLQGIAWVFCLRTGGRLHPGLAGERLLKQRPKLLSRLSWRPSD